MDARVYEKEEVLQPSGAMYVYKPNIIDFVPVIDTDEEGNEIITNVELIGDSEIEQQCALATIWQKGLDPVEPDTGISWAETLLGEVNVVQLMEELRTAVAEVTNSVQVDFDTVTDDNGTSYLTYTLKGANDNAN